MTDTILPGEILARLDLVVFERLPDGVFVRVGSAQPPTWFSRLFLDAAQHEPVTIAQAFPFLDRFLAEAEDFWREKREHRLRSDPFILPDPSGGDIALLASAVVIGNTPFLILELPSDFEGAPAHAAARASRFLRTRSPSGARARCWHRSTPRSSWPSSSRRLSSHPTSNSSRRESASNSRTLPLQSRRWLRCRKVSLAGTVPDAHFNPSFVRGPYRCRPIPT